MNVARRFYRTAHPVEHTPLENRLTTTHFIHLRKDECGYSLTFHLLTLQTYTDNLDKQ